MSPHSYQSRYKITQAKVYRPHSGRQQEQILNAFGSYDPAVHQKHEPEGKPGPRQVSRKTASMVRFDRDNLDIEIPFPP